MLSEQEARRAVVDDAIVWFRGSVEGVLKTVTDSVTAMKSTATDPVGDLERNDGANRGRGANLQLCL